MLVGIPGQDGTRAGGMLEASAIRGGCDSGRGEEWLLFGG